MDILICIVNLSGKSSGHMRQERGFARINNEPSLICKGLDNLRINKQSKLNGEDDSDYNNSTN